MSYFAFGIRQPDGIDGNPLDYISFFASDSFRVHDFHCAYNYGGCICEK